MANPQPGFFPWVLRLDWPREMKSPIQWPYEPLVDGTICVDDPNSHLYNQLVNETNSTSKDWQSAELMREIGEPYKWGIVVEHNRDPIVPGGGSCIFLHVWGGPESRTAGCTAMESAFMQELITWLDPGAKPLLVQFPYPVYKQLRASWNLPVLE